MNDAQGIPAFALFGEFLGEPDPQFVHIETIDARSSKYEWEISPHRHPGFSQLLILREQAAQVHLDGKVVQVSPPAVIIASAGCVHGFRFDPDTVGEVLTLATDFGARLSGPARALLEHPRIVRLQPGPAEGLDELARLLLAAEDNRQPGGRELMLALAEAFVRLLAQGLGEESTPPSGGDKAQQLRRLVESHFVERRKLAFYAGRLALSERSLGRLCQEAFGCSPTALLHRRLAQEAMRMLHYTNAPVARIAEQLGFADPSYFSRFYLRMTGRSPGDERALCTRRTKPL